MEAARRRFGVIYMPTRRGDWVGGWGWADGEIYRSGQRAERATSNLRAQRATGIGWVSGRKAVGRTCMLHVLDLETSRILSVPTTTHSLQAHSVWLDWEGKTGVLAVRSGVVGTELALAPPCSLILRWLCGIGDGYMYRQQPMNCSAQALRQLGSRRVAHGAMHVTASVLGVQDGVQVDR